MKDYEKQIESLEAWSESESVVDLQKTLQTAVKLLKKINDERNSVWDMIEEMRASEIENHTEEFRKMMDRRLIEIKMLANMKPELA